MPLVEMEVLESWETVPVGEPIDLRFVVTRPELELGAVVLPAGQVVCAKCTVNSDLFTDAIELKQGESTSLTVTLQFDQPGYRDLSEFELQVNPVEGPDRDHTLVPLPAHPFRVVPSLNRALKIELVRICAYDDAVKTEVVLRNTSSSDIRDLELTIGPKQHVRTGPLRRHYTQLRPDEEVKFDLVLTSQQVEFHLSAHLSGETVTGTRTLAVPSADHAQDAVAKPFVFLEPRAFSTDRISLVPEGHSNELTSSGGVYRVLGDKARYTVTISPSHPEATNVSLHGVPGQVEVELVETAGRQWKFSVTVIETSWTPTLVKLDYDVQIPGSPSRGEVHFSIQPRSRKLWRIAIALGFGVTIKSSIELGHDLIHGDSAEMVLTTLGDVFVHRWFDLMQILSIVFCRGGLSVFTYLYNWFQES